MDVDEETPLITKRKESACTQFFMLLMKIVLNIKHNKKYATDSPVNVVAEECRKHKLAET